MTRADRVAEELGRLEGVGEAGLGALNLGDIEPCESVMLCVSRPPSLSLHCAPLPAGLFFAGPIDDP